MGIWNKLKESAIEMKKESAIRKAQKREARDVYLEEKGKQEIEFAREKAKVESQARIKALKQSYNRPRGNPMGSILGAGQGAMGFITAGMPGFQQPKIKKTPKTRAKTKYVIVGGKAVPLAQRTRIKRPKKIRPQMQGYNWF